MECRALIFRLPRLTVLPLLLLLCGPSFAAEHPQPDPDLPPEQVVQAQLDALKAGTDADLVAVYRFASPGNQAATGPSGRFVELLKRSFGMLVSHQSAELAPLFQNNDEAMQPVVVVDRDGQTHRFVWMLRRYELEGCEGCWLTDGVVPPESLAGPGR